MSIWFGNPDIADTAKLAQGTIHDALGIVVTEIGDNYVMATMPVDERTVQPYGILHGGASIVLAESLGSIASHYVVDSEKYIAVGLDINANHLRPVRSGLVTGKATPIHLGRKNHVWDIEIRSDRDKLVCKSRLTIAVIKKDELGGK
ncbi:MAG: hotdog fold thioesterase [Salibacteraceae bacterium]|nr:hotdog fold thioesterase [Salibacteraceae bacterium]|tara:strand:+ start:15185 stop:15625 length:441 start_codon:yes stop_codon:yes gene_type:complete